MADINKIHLNIKEVIWQKNAYIREMYYKGEISRSKNHEV